MGALNRATFSEVEQLSAGDVGWWFGFCARVVEAGPLVAIREERDLRGWSEGAFRQWLRADVERYREFDLAVKDHADAIGWETKEIADATTPETVGVSKLRNETRFRLAKQAHPETWGEKAQTKESVRVVLVGFREEGGRVIECEADAARVAVIDSGGAVSAETQGE